MKKGIVLGCLMAFHHSNYAGVAGRKGVSDDQLFVFTACLIGVLLLLGFSKELIAGIKQLWEKYDHKESHH
jgi:hypothetical protein